MAIYYALITGDGDGCDYTIACNKDFRRLKATTLEAAKREVIDNGYPGEESPVIPCDAPYIAKILLVEVVSEVDCASEIEAERAADAERKAEASRQAKRAQLAALKRELGEE